MEEQVTDIWNLLEIGKNYNRNQNLYEEGTENWNYYHGRQWEGLKRPKSSGEPITLNVIKPIVKYKVNIVNQNSYQIVFNPNTYESEEQMQYLKDVTKGLNTFVNKMWEKSQTGKKVRSVTRSACVVSEGIMYFYNNGDTIASEELDKNNIYYGNENEPDIQKQPYILVTMRKPVRTVREMARNYREMEKNTLSDEEIKHIASDMDFWEESGRDKRLMEVSPSCTVVVKYERNDEGIVEISMATRTVELIKNQSTDMKLYPFAHYIWEDEKGYARGTSEVSGLKENQREINKTATRRAIAVKIGAYPKLVVDTEFVANPSSLQEVGSTIRLTGMRSDDVRKAVNYLNPASMSTDAYNLQKDLIDGTKELAGAGDTAVGNVDPTQASGKAILAVQQASQQPIAEQVENYKYFLEDCGKVLFEMIKASFVDGLTLYQTEDIINDLGETETIDRPFKISQEELQSLDLDFKIDITPQTAYDKLAQELSLENMLVKGYITLEEYTESLPEDSSMPKQTLAEILRRRRERRKEISRMQQEAEALNGAIQQELIAQGGGLNDVSQMQQPSGNDSYISAGQQVPEQM